MHDTVRIEKLAEIGLRLIVTAYDAHPRSIALGTADGLGLTNFDASNFNDPNERERRMQSESGRLVVPLLDCMLADGVFHGRQSAAGGSFVTLSHHVRLGLRKTSENRSRLDRIRQALTLAFHGGPIANGELTSLAREIGFEP